jgi:hypothetical protein
MNVWSVVIPSVCRAIKFTFPSSFFLFSVFFPRFPLHPTQSFTPSGLCRVAFLCAIFVFRFLVFLFSGFSCFSILFYLLSLFLLSGGFMAHLVESMAYVNQVPWHGLGNQLTAKQPIEVWAQQAGMAFDIKETPVRFMTESIGSLGAIMSFPEQKVLYRSDTKAALSVVSNRYQVVQPREILEFYRDLTEISGFELETAGVLKEGRKVWALAKTNQSSVLKGNDVVNAYLLLATACDGTLATTAQFTSIGWCAITRWRLL